MYRNYCICLQTNPYTIYIYFHRKIWHHTFSNSERFSTRRADGNSGNGLKWGRSECAVVHLMSWPLIHCYLITNYFSLGFVKQGFAGFLCCSSILPSLDNTNWGTETSGFFRASWNYPRSRLFSTSSIDFAIKPFPVFLLCNTFDFGRTLSI